MLRLVPTWVLLVRPQIPSVLHRNLFHLKQRTHLVFSLLHTLLTFCCAQPLPLQSSSSMPGTLFQTPALRRTDDAVPRVSRPPYRSAPLLSCSPQRARRSSSTNRHDSVIRCMKYPILKNPKTLLFTPCDTARAALPCR